MRVSSFLRMTIALSIVTSCADDSSSPGGDGGTDTDADVDADADSDTDTNSDTDTDSDSETSTDTELFDWVAISGGTYMMGTEGASTSSNEYPQHEVTVPSFEILRTEVTLAQYRACVEAGACTEPMPDTYEPSDLEDWEPYITWGKEGRDDHPINAVNWYQAVEFCTWAGGRLPSEAEWEYAARSLGQDNTYPWGEEDPTCEYAIMWEDMATAEYACDAGTTWPVCSKPAGNTEQGLCDMAGSIMEMVQDCYHDNYEGAPIIAEPWEIDCAMEGYDDRVIRGGDFTVYPAVWLRTKWRDYTLADMWFAYVGFRCAR